MRLPNGLRAGRCIPVNIHSMGKSLIRKAFAGAVGNSRVNGLKALAERTCSDKEFADKVSKYDCRRPFTKESLL